MRTIVYYVSGHGFGHARRTAEVLRALSARRGDVRVVVRTSAPQFLFRGIENVSVEALPYTIDPGVVERDSLTIDPAASMRRVAAVLPNRAKLAEAEAAAVRAYRAELIAADIAFLAGDVARLVGVPCVAVGNFTWDWIYEPFVRTEEDARLVEGVRESYRKFDSLLQLPFGHEANCFEKIVQAPLVASRCRRAPAEVERRLGLRADGLRRRVLVGMRGGMDDQVLFRVARASPELVFVVPVRVRAGAPENLIAVDANSPEVDFADLLEVCDVVVSKVGYGILADCIAAKKALVYPRREGFREDEVSLAVCPGYLRMREIERGAFAAGDWAESLRAILAQPAPAGAIAVNGEEVVAKLLLELGSKGLTLQPI